MLDALARLRFDEPTLLTALEAHVAGALERGALHEAQAACVVESFGTLRYRPRAELLTKLLERVLPPSGLSSWSLAAMAASTSSASALRV